MTDTTDTPNGDEPQKKDEHTVPLSVLKAEQNKYKKLEAQVASLLTEKEDREKSEMSELEQARREAQEAKQERDRFRSQYSKAERSNKIQAAAVKAGFADPADAVLFSQVLLDSDDELDDAAIEEHVNGVLEQRQYLKSENLNTTPGRVGGGAPGSSGGADRQEPNPNDDWAKQLIFGQNQ